MPNEDPATSSWHLDKRVPIALIVTLLLQGAGFVWWSATLSARVENIERTVAASADQGSRLVRVETQLGYIQKSVDGLDAKLDKLIADQP